MPNHVQNRVEIIGTEEIVNEVLEFIKGEEDAFDFNNVISRPDELDITSSSEGNDGMKYLVGVNERGIGYQNSEHYKYMEKMKAENPERFEKCISLGKNYLNNIVNHGYITWYEWSIDKWGTKWNAYEVEQHENVVEFQTAWSAPHPVIEALAERFPDVKFIHKWADEATAYNCGERGYEDGKLFEYLPDEGSREAYDLAFELRPYLKDDYELVDGEYRYKDED
ncbi:hypothetical protein [Clavibacter sp.]|uniref:DUF1281 family ferredoxin-like fold protein n=1 Tax=Clavibacter sp. TaxID=1871044 RepID=UPI00199E4E98|nr:hypothetical protein [Clavibacter sp.]MBD5381917.1 hypothetical protein [Clavibacter sp.]